MDYFEKEIREDRGNGDKETGERKKKRRRPVNELNIITYFFVGLFFLMTAYFAYYVQFKAPTTINSSYNMRQKNLAKRVIRGKIFAAGGEVLAEQAINPEGAEVRYYPYKEKFAQAVGYSTHGASGVESVANIALLTSDSPVDERLQKEMAGVRNYGDDIYTTFDVKLQEKAVDALGVYKGALYENMVGEALVKSGCELSYYKRNDSTLEQDFFLRTSNSLVPVEVKSQNGRAKSLRTLIGSEKYTDICFGVKMTNGNIGYSDHIYTFPYFCTFLLREFLKTRIFDEEKYSGLFDCLYMTDQPYSLMYSEKNGGFNPMYPCLTEITPRFLSLSLYVE